MDRAVSLLAYLRTMSFLPKLWHHICFTRIQITLEKGWGRGEREIPKVMDIVTTFLDRRRSQNKNQVEFENTKNIVFLN